MSYCAKKKEYIESFGLLQFRRKKDATGHRS